MRSYTTAAIWVAGVVLAGAQASGQTHTPPAAPATARTLGTPEHLPKETVVISGEVFYLERPVTSEQTRRGLMGRQEIPPDGGMLFVFPEPGPRKFWMAYTLVDLDLIYLDGSGRLTTVHRMKAEPARTVGESEQDYYDRLPRYASRGQAQFAIELKAGSLDLLKLAVGDTILLDIPHLQRLARQAQR